MHENHGHEPHESRLRRTLSAGRKVLTAELAVPATIEHERIIERVQELARPEIVAVNITDGLRGRPALSPIAAAAILTHAAVPVEPIVQLTARTRTRNAVIADLLGASALGIRNLLCMTGDVPVDSGDFRDVDVFGLIQLARTFPRDLGTDLLGGAEPFFVGATWSPFDSDEEMELARLERKIAAGAQFVQTQPVFEARGFLRVAERLPGSATSVPILVGLAPIRSAQHGRRLAGIPGVHVPQRLLDMLDGAPSEQQAAERFWPYLADELLEIAALPCVRGFHLMPIGHSRRGIAGKSTFDRLYETAAPLVHGDGARA